MLTTAAPSRPVIAVRAASEQMYTPITLTSKRRRSPAIPMSADGLL